MFEFDFNQDHQHSEDPALQNHTGVGIATQIARLKAFAPITQILVEQSTILDQGEREELSRVLYAKVQLETDTLCQMLDVDPVECPWIAGQIAPIVSEQVALTYRMYGLDGLKTSITPAFMPALLAQYAVTFPSCWDNRSDAVAIMSSALKALRLFDDAYQEGDLGHPNSLNVKGWAKDLLWKGSQHCINVISDEIGGGVDGDPVILQQAMLLDCGRILARCWRQSDAQYKTNLSVANNKRRFELVRDGYSLDTVASIYDNSVNAQINLMASLSDQILGLNQTQEH